MSRHPVHTIHSRHHHCGWDNAIAPARRIAPGETIEFNCLDAAGGHFDASSSAADIATMDPAGINPVTGPVYVDGARPGDTLRITLESFSPSGFGWTAIIPGFGLLADQFPEPHLHLWTYDRDLASPG
ncbi:MAG TPA: acetamidase/formamidase family protein, partial [Afifellaceae bacterium]|nr:acetamidase/formamidase family protein [Afifellaceae bacterium]